MLPHARLMIYDPRVERIGGTALEIEERSKDIMRVRNITGTIIAEHTGKTLDEILAKTAVDSYFNAEEAIAFGLANSILKRIWRES